MSTPSPTTDEEGNTTQTNTGNFTGGVGWGTYNSVVLNSCSGGKFVMTTGTTLLQMAC